MTIWLAVTADRFELPLAVEDSAVELAKRMGVSRRNIYKKLSDEQGGRILEGYAVRKVDEDDAEKIEGGTMTMPDTEDYFVFDRTGTPHVVVAVKAEISGDCPQSGNRAGGRSAWAGQHQVRKVGRKRDKGGAA